MEFLILCLGWIGGICFAICSIPQAIKSIRNGNSDGVSNGMLWLWGIGEVTTLLYVIMNSIHFEIPMHWPLIFNYSINLIGLGIIIWYKVYPEHKVIRNDKSTQLDSQNK